MSGSRGFFVYLGWPIAMMSLLAKIDDARHSAQKLANFVCVLLFLGGLGGMTNRKIKI